METYEWLIYMLILLPSMCTRNQILCYTVLDILICDYFNILSACKLKIHSPVWWIIDMLYFLVWYPEEEFVRQSLATRAIPSPKFLIKDHKTINEKGEFPTRLVISATSVTATFSKTGYLGIKRSLDKVKVNYSQNSFVQASDLKETL